VISGRKNRFADCFRLGCLSHHVADYFTAPHNRTGVAGFCMDHRGYENQLHLYFKEQMANEGVMIEDLSIRSIGFWKQMESEHEKYLEEIALEESFETDYSYIKAQNMLIFSIFMSVRLAETKGNLIYA
jgi:hypothetical protein